MTAYVLVRSDDLVLGDELRRYVAHVDATLEAHGARILVQSWPAQVLEGSWAGFVTVLEFDDLGAARAWYASPEYAALRGLRLESSTPTTILLDGVPDGHRSADLLAAVRAQPD